MKKAILYTAMLALAATTLLAGIGAGAPITAGDAPTDAGTDVVTSSDVTPQDYCVDPQCDCTYDPETGQYYGDCDEYT